MSEGKENVYDVSQEHDHSNADDGVTVTPSMSVSPQAPSPDDIKNEQTQSSSPSSPKKESSSVHPEEVDDKADCDPTTEVQDKDKGSSCDSSNQTQDQDHGKDKANLDDWFSSLSKDALFQAISKYRKAVSDEKNHADMLKSGTVSGFLMLCMSHEDPEVVEASFEVIFALSKNQNNIYSLLGLKYFVNSLRFVSSNVKVKETVRRDAKKLIVQLKSSGKESQCHPLSELSESTKNVMSNSGNVNIPKATTMVDGNTTGTVKPVDLNVTMSTMKRKNKGRETILFVDNNKIPEKSVRTQITQALIGVKGIISVTYDLKKNFCIIRGKRTVAPETFGEAVAALAIADVYLVRKNENNEEVKILIQTNEKENSQYPPYPEELENEEIDNSAAVARTDKGAGDNKSVFKSVKNFFKSSFYW